MQVVERANDVQYGLSASVWSTDVGKIHRVAHKLEVISFETLFRLMFSLLAIVAKLNFNWSLWCFLDKRSFLIAIKFQGHVAGQKLAMISSNDL